MIIAEISNPGKDMGVSSGLSRAAESGDSDTPPGSAEVVDKGLIN